MWPNSSVPKVSRPSAGSTIIITTIRKISSRVQAFGPSPSFPEVLHGFGCQRDSPWRAPFRNAQAEAETSHQLCQVISNSATGLESG